MLRRFFAYYRPYRGLFFLDFGCAVVSGLLELGFPMAVRTFVDRLLPGQDWSLILPRLSRAARDLPDQHCLDGRGHLLGPHARHQHRDRDAPPQLRPPPETLVPLLRQQQDRPPRRPASPRISKRSGRSRITAPKTCSSPVMTFIGAFILMFTVNPHLALLTTIIVPASALVAGRYGGRMTGSFRTPVRPRRPVQTCASRRMSAACASSRRSATRTTSAACSPRTTAATARPSSKRIALWPPAPRSAICRCARRRSWSWSPAPGSCCTARCRMAASSAFLLLIGVFFPPGGKDQRRAGTIPQGHRRLSPLLRAAGHRARHRRRTRRHRCPAVARRHQLRARDLRLQRRRRRAARKST